MSFLNVNIHVFHQICGISSHDLLLSQTPLAWAGCGPSLRAGVMGALTAPLLAGSLLFGVGSTASSHPGSFT